MSISAVVLTKNEEEQIARCLASLSWCDEIIIIDDSSTDKTITIAKKYNVKIHNHPLSNNFAQQRNFGLGKASGEWVFFVDADEVVPLSLREEITFRIHSRDVFDAYSLNRKDFMWEREMQFGESGATRFVRLGKKNSGVWRGNVHEVWHVEGMTGSLKNSLFHYPHQSIEEFISEVNLYTDIRSKELFDRRVPVRISDIVLYPKLKFIYTFFLRAGFLDGIEGFLFAIIMSFHSFLVRAKLWLLWQEKKRVKT